MITAGPTREPLDPVRYISNHSSGKNGLRYCGGRSASRRKCHAGLRSRFVTDAAFCKNGFDVITALDMEAAVQGRRSTAAHFH
ncbi:flavoprotein [Salmonella enterica subsp. enterica]|uniref:Flavoprotein n=1 Tax=Salmonella enterica I TaxID=59201 RepID=A0A447TSC3_SALET|nr:flavoprotein [Salmonella enterica subsp. enterica]